MNDLSFEVQPGVPFGLFYIALTRMGTQANPCLFEVLANGIMITNVKQ